MKGYGLDFTRMLCCCSLALLMWVGFIFMVYGVWKFWEKYLG